MKIHAEKNYLLELEFTEHQLYDLLVELRHLPNREDHPELNNLQVGIEHALKSSDEMSLLKSI